MKLQTPRSTLFPYTTLFRSSSSRCTSCHTNGGAAAVLGTAQLTHDDFWIAGHLRSEEHTSELQSHVNLVCRLLLEKKNSFEGGNRKKYKKLSRMHATYK